MKKKKNINIFTQNYPSKSNPYASAFVHSRCKGYKEQGYNINVYSLTNENNNYTFDGIKVFQANEKQLGKIMKNVDTLCCHMPNMREMRFLDKYFPIMRLIFWFHGNESIWSAFLYPYHGNILLIPLKFLRRLWIDVKKRGFLKEFIKRRKPTLVFVSRWMLNETQKLLGELPKKYCNLIPNPVDEKVFFYKQRKGKIKKIICVRPHTTRKYAIDLVIESFKNSKYALHLYGKGPLLNKHRKLAKKLNANVVFFPKLLPQKELAELYVRYTLGIMLTRLDSQGVSACEMQMTGMPIITSDIEGNKEFKTSGTFRIDNSNLSIVEKIIDKINRDGNLAELSKKSREEMVEIAGSKYVIKKEIELIKKHNST